MDRVTSRLALAIVDVVEFRCVWDRLKPIIVLNTIRRLNHSRTYTFDDIVAISLQKGGNLHYKHNILISLNPIMSTKQQIPF